MRRAGLQTRLARLEKRNAVRRLPQVVLAIMDCDLGDCLGFTVDGLAIYREANESAADCASRCFAMPGTRIAIMAIHP